MSKNDFAKEVAYRLETSIKNASAAIDAVFDAIKEEMANGGEVNIGGFGKFTTTQKAERYCKIPSTGEEVFVPSKTSPKFKPAQALKDAVNGEDESE